MLHCSWYLSWIQV